MGSNPVEVKVKSHSRRNCRLRVTAAELRKHNDFFGDRFELCEVLRIPIKGREPHVLKNRQVGQDTRQGRV